MSTDLTELIQQSMPFSKSLGIRAVEFSPERVVLELDWAAETTTGNGIMHGGVLMALADSAGATCAFANLPDGAAGTTTIESKTNFLGAVRSGSVIATSTALHAGATTIVIETELHNGDKLVAKVTQTQAVLQAR